MNLLGKELIFGDKNQILICRRLDQDARTFGKIGYLTKTLTDTYSLGLIKMYNELKSDKDNNNDKYIKSLIQAKMNGIIDDLVKPILEQKKQYYENYFPYALQEKREIERKILQKKCGRDDVILPF